MEGKGVLNPAAHKFKVENEEIKEECEGEVNGHDESCLVDVCRGDQNMCEKRAKYICRD